MVTKEEKKNDEILNNLCSLFQTMQYLNEKRMFLFELLSVSVLFYFDGKKFEAIYNTIFDTYWEKSDCDEKLVGKRISRKKKRIIGGWLTLIFLLIWLEPLKLFSSLNPTNQLNNLTGAKINVDFFSTIKMELLKNIISLKIQKMILYQKLEKIIEILYRKSEKIETVKTINFKKGHVQHFFFSETSLKKSWFRHFSYKNFNIFIRLAK